MRSNLFAIALVLFFTVSGYAASEPFVEFKSFETKDKYQSVASAVFKMGGVKKETRCTGTYISNEGHALTAAHCLSRCFNVGLDEVKKWPLSVSVNGKPSRHAVSAFKWSYPQKCRLSIGGVEEEVEILSGPKGMLTNRLPFEVAVHFRQYFSITAAETDEYKAKWTEAFLNHWGFGADFAVFKLVKKTKTECLKLSKSNSFSGEHYVLSYPGTTSLGSTKINHKMYLSRGEVYPGNYFNSQLIVIKDQTGRYLNSSLEAYAGSSGAGLIDSTTGEVSGVLSIVSLDSDRGGQVPVARFVSSKVVREVAGDVLQDFDCKP